MCGKQGGRRRFKAPNHALAVDIDVSMLTQHLVPAQSGDLALLDPRCVQVAIAKRGSFSIVLSGGSLVKALG